MTSCLEPTVSFWERIFVLLGLSGTLGTGCGVSMQKTTLAGPCVGDPKVLLYLYEVLDFAKTSMPQVAWPPEVPLYLL